MIKVGIVGTGRRAAAFADHLINEKKVRQRAQLVGLHDINHARMAAFEALYAPGVRMYPTYEALLGKADLNAVIVATPCNTHASLTIRAFEAGKYVVCEKAMAITAADLKAMLDAEASSGLRMQLGLCLRYTDFMRELIPIVRRGEIGDIVTVSAVETLEGGDHFNRWHRDKSQSGGIMLQKGTHTLDLINWIVDSRPKTITSIGGRSVFRPRSECAGRRCLTCPDAQSCPEFLDITAKEASVRLYRECEHEDGYIWDRCVFDPAAELCDNVMTQIEYENGCRAQHAISLFFQDVGIEREFTILGTTGRITVSRRREEIIIRRRRSRDIIRYNLEGHGEGFDLEMMDFLDMVETGKVPVADGQAGYWSAIAGIAAERSMKEQRTIQIAELIR